MSGNNMNKNTSLLFCRALAGAENGLAAATEKPTICTYLAPAGKNVPPSHPSKIMRCRIRVTDMFLLTH